MHTTFYLSLKYCSAKKRIWHTFSLTLAFECNLIFQLPHKPLICQFKSIVGYLCIQYETKKRESLILPKLLNLILVLKKSCRNTTFASRLRSNSYLSCSSKESEIILEFSHIFFVNPKKLSIVMKNSNIQVLKKIPFIGKS